MKEMNDKEAHENLSSFIKNVHKKLKENYKNTIPCGKQHTEQVWEKHCSDTELLSKYASAMHQLAKEFWKDSTDGNRITWCHKYIESYFLGGILDKLKLKDQKRAHFNAAESCSLKNVVKQHPAEGRIRILDVGSCYNPFKNCDKFCVVALDLCPAVESVLQCDFLKLRVDDLSFDFKDQRNGDQYAFDYKSCESYFESLEGPLESLPRNSFHVVIFSLLLDYLPSAEQRFLACVKAFRLLNQDGILMIVSPDSRKQHRNLLMTRSWRTAIESIGFQRCTYEKLEHLHCMAFRKTSIESPFSLVGGAKLEPQTSFLSSMVALMGVPQDKHEKTSERDMVSGDGESQGSQDGIIDFLNEFSAFSSTD